MDTATDDFARAFACRGFHYNSGAAWAPTRVSVVEMGTRLPLSVGVTSGVHVRHMPRLCTRCRCAVPQQYLALVIRKNYVTSLHHVDGNIFFNLIIIYYLFRKKKKKRLRFTHETRWKCGTSFSPKLQWAAGTLLSERFGLRGNTRECDFN